MNFKIFLCYSSLLLMLLLNMNLISILNVGVHLEGPFISLEKKGAHPPQCISTFDNGMEDLLKMYGSLEDVALVTLAPELKKSSEVIDALVQRGIAVSLGELFQIV